VARGIGQTALLQIPAVWAETKKGVPVFEEKENRCYNLIVWLFQ